MKPLSPEGRGEEDEAPLPEGGREEDEAPLPEGEGLG